MLVTRGVVVGDVQCVQKLACSEDERFLRHFLFMYVQVSRVKADAKRRRVHAFNDIEQVGEVREMPAEIFKADAKTEFFRIGCEQLQLFRICRDDLFVCRIRTERMTVAVQNGIFDADRRKQLKPVLQNGNRIDFFGTETDCQPQMTLREGQIVFLCLSTKGSADFSGRTFALEQNCSMLIGQFTDGQSAAFHSKYHVLGGKVHVIAGPDAENFGIFHIGMILSC